MDKVETLGSHALKAQKEDTQSDFIELQREIHKGSHSKKSYEEEVWECIDRGRKDSKISGDFFIVVVFKKERIFHNVVRQFFFYRQSCPTPEFDQTVYKYFRKEDEIEFLWTIPNNAACLNLPLMEKNLPEDQKLLISMVKAFRSGELDQYAKILNKEVVK